MSWHKEGRTHRSLIILIRLLLDRDSEPLRIGVVKEKNSPEQRTLSYTLRTNEMHVSVQLNLGIRDMRTIQENYFIQVSHLVPLLLC